MNKIEWFENTTAGVEQSLEYLRTQLDELKATKKEINRAMLLSEEFIVHVQEQCAMTPKFRIKLATKLGVPLIAISCIGPEIDFSESADIYTMGGGLSENEDLEAAIRNSLISSFKTRMKFSYKEGLNRAVIVAGNLDQRQIIATAVGLGAGVLVGLLMNLNGGSVVEDFFDEQILKPLTLMFIHALNMIILPVVFFGVLNAVLHLLKFRKPGKVGLKIIVGYLFTSVVAILIGFEVFKWVDPGQSGIVLKYMEFSAKERVDTYSDVAAFLMDLIPTNVVVPFLHGYSLQIISMAVIAGLAIDSMTEHSKFLAELAEAIDAMLNRILEILMSMIPIAVFVSVATTIDSLGIRGFLEGMKLIVTLAIALLVLGLFYGLLVLVVARLNPLPLFKKFMPSMLSMSSVSGGDETLIQMMQFAGRGLGIDRRLINFSMPLGAILNTDGQCIYLAVVAPFLAKICGVDIFASGRIGLIIIMIVLALGAPNMIGSGLVCLTAVASQFGFPLLSLSAIVGIDYVLTLLLTAMNVLGDLVISLIVANTSGMLKKETYQKIRK